ncbi:MAG: LAGLIDADG family homing endonuclease [Candidatus Jorgensenbacteria bacterium]
MEKLPGDYIAGFVDGEGCFALKFRRDVRHERKGKPEYFYWDIEFVIGLKADDKDILERIRDTMGCGRLGNIDRRGLVRYAVNDVRDLVKKVIPFFEKYPLHAKKRHDFKLWSEAVTIFTRNQRKGVNAGKGGFQKTEWNGRDLQRIKEIKEEMATYKGGNRHNWKWLP